MMRDTQHILNENRITTEWYNVLNSVRWISPYFVTPTQKQFLGGYNKRGYFQSTKIGSIESSINTKHFLNRLNQKCFGNSFRRFNRRIKSFVVMEGNTKTVRHHLHMILEKPPTITESVWLKLINDCWSKTTYGYRHLDIQPIYDVEILNQYLLKTKTKVEDIQSTIDVMNTHF